MKTVHARFLFLLLVFTMAGSVDAATLKVTEAAVTTKVSKGKPIDSVHRISHRTVKALYFFTRTVTSAKGGTTLRHIWSRDGQVVKEADLQAKTRHWRSYSTLPVNAGSVGQWRVELRDEAGTVLKTLEFKVH